MKRIIFKTGIAFLLLFVMGGGCKKEGQDCTTIAVNGAEDDITGKWKLITFSWHAV